MKLEARILADRLALKPAIVEKWMRANGLKSILDLQPRYPGLSHADCMSAAAVELHAHHRAETT